MSAFGGKADVPTFVILRDQARFRPVSARNSQIVFGAFGRRKFVYIVSTYEKAPHGGGAKSLILWCRHQESNSGPTDYKSSTTEIWMAASEAKRTFVSLNFQRCELPVSAAVSTGRCNTCINSFCWGFDPRVPGQLVINRH